MGQKSRFGLNSLKKPQKFSQINRITQKLVPGGLKVAEHEFGNKNFYDIELKV